MAGVPAAFTASVPAPAGSGDAAAPGTGAPDAPPTASRTRRCGRSLGTETSSRISTPASVTPARISSLVRTTDSETINYSGTAGFYEWDIFAYSGSGTFQFCMKHPN